MKLYLKIPLIMVYSSIMIIIMNIFNDLYEPTSDQLIIIGFVATWTLMFSNGFDGCIKK